jgi:hypothetical protein
MPAQAAAITAMADGPLKFAGWAPPIMDFIYSESRWALPTPIRWTRGLLPQDPTSGPQGGWGESRTAAKTGLRPEAAIAVPEER